MLESDYDAYLQDEGNDETHMTHESRPTLFPSKPMRTIFKHNFNLVVTTRLIDFWHQAKNQLTLTASVFTSRGANKSMET